MLRRTIRRCVPAVLVAATAVTAGCESWFGDDKKETLPGKRVSVLAHQQTLVPDAAAAATPVRLSAPVLNPDWPQESGPPDLPGGHLSLSASPAKVWQVSIGKGPRSRQPRVPAPVVADGRVFTMDAANRVTAFELASGRKQWSTDLTEREDNADDGIAGGIAVLKGRLFATTGFARVIALDAATGKEIWRRALAAPVHGAPMVDAGRVFVTTVNNALYGLNGADGRDLWPPHQAISEAAGVLGTAAPVAAGDSVIAAFSSGDLVAVRTATGRVIWSESLASARRTDELTSVAHIRGRPVVDGGRVFAVSYGAQLAAVNVRTGERLWDRPIGGLYGPWVAGNHLFVVSGNQELVCLTKDSGAIVWIAQLPAYADDKARKDPIIWAGPVAAGERLIVAGSNGKALFLSLAGGRVAGELDLESGVSQVPVVADGRLLVVTDDGTLTVYR
jgi:outer membrane protein assembly factor BamB